MGAGANELMNLVVEQAASLDVRAERYVERYREEALAAGVHERIILTNIYWNIFDIPVDAIVSALRMSERQILAITGPGEATCICHNHRCMAGITLMAKDRAAKAFIESLEIYCPNCAKERMFAWQDARDAAAVAEQEHIRRLKAMPYQEYLLTAHWQEVRQEALEAQGRHCQLCRAAGPLQVHHNTYERRGEEAAGDLLVLCADCHQNFHDNGKLARPPAE